MKPNGWAEQFAALEKDEKSYSYHSSGKPGPLIKMLLLQQYSEGQGMQVMPTDWQLHAGTQCLS